MFGFDPFTMALVGGAVGGLLDKKAPLRGAALGALGGYGGGLLASPVSAGAVGEGAAAALADPAANIATAAQYGTNIGSQQTAMLAAQEAGGLAAPSMLSQAKPFMDAAGTAQQIAGMTNQPKQQMPIVPSPMTTPMPTTNIGNMVAQMQQGQAQQMNFDKQQRMQRAQQRRGLLA
jgi:hypothetical protein